MRPVAWTWRKTLRAESKGIYRRHKRTVETEQPRPDRPWYPMVNTRGEKET